MTHGFDRDYWQAHWRQTKTAEAGWEIDPNPYLTTETIGLIPGTALDAGCGEGAEAVWLAAQGWNITAVDISGEALARAAERARRGDTAPGRLLWVEADLSVWEPSEQFDLVTTHYAHPAIPQLEFYQRISKWVTPGGTLLIVGHLHTPSAAGHDHDHRARAHEHDHNGHPPAKASVTAAGITAKLDAKDWDVVTAEERSRTLTDPAGREVQLQDVVVRATRRS